MDDLHELHALLLKFRDVQQRAEMHRERAEALEWEVVDLRGRVRKLVNHALADLHGTE